MLERSFSLVRGPGMRIRRFALTAIKPGAVLEGSVVFEADWNYQIDNMEGLGQIEIAGDSYAAIHARALRLGGGLARGGRDLFRDFFLEVAGLGRKLAIARLHQKRVETAAMIDGFQCVGADAKPHALPEGIALQRHVTEIRKEPPLGLDVGMAHLVTDEYRLAGEFAAPRHDRTFR